MKKILFLVVFMVFSLVDLKAGPPQCGGGTAGNCRGCDGGYAQANCCTSNNWIGDASKGCTTANSPINKGLIFLLIAGIGLGAFVVYKNNRLKLV